MAAFSRRASTADVTLTLHNDPAPEETARLAERFSRENVLARLRALDARARRSGVAELSAADDSLIAIGMEADANGRVTRNCYGVFDLSWQSAEHPEWAEQLAREAGELRTGIRDTHGVPLRFLIWAGMGGSIEDKSMFEACGLLRGGPAFYALDSTDPAKLKAILADIERRSRRPLRDALRSTAVVGMALGMTSYEPVVNLEKLSALFERWRIDARPNFLYLTLPGSLLDQFAAPRGFRRVPLQLDGDYTTAGRHSGPLTRGSLYPIALAPLDLRRWIKGTQLGDGDIAAAWTLASFLHANGERGRDKVTLLLPREWRGAALWTKQDFEESLGKSETLGIKIVIGERIHQRHYHRVDDPLQDRLFVTIRTRPAPSDLAVQAMRRAGYPIAAVKMPAATPLSAYMQFVHYAVFGVGYLRNMNFVTQPSVELYKKIAAGIYAEARQAGGVAHTTAWRSMIESPRRAVWRRRLTLYYDTIGERPGFAQLPEDAAATYAALLANLFDSRTVEYGELTFFGDLRYAARGRAMHDVLQRAAERVFRRGLRAPVDVYEGPAMNHSYHEMIIGHGRCFSTVLLSKKQDAMPSIAYDAEYHVAQFLATRMALAERRRPVVAIVVNDLSDASLRAAGDFVEATAARLKERRRAS